MARAKPKRDRFGRHVRSLRAARGLTQQEFAERSGLASDTIRRIEQTEFSPSLNTLSKLVDGLELRLSTLFLGEELGERDLARELRDLVERQSPRDAQLGIEALRVLFAELDAAKADGVSIWDADPTPQAGDYR